MSSQVDSTVTERILELVRQGDRTALSRLLAIHRDYLRRLIDLRMDDKLRGRIDPSDVVQETQMVVTRRIEDFLVNRPFSFRLWLRQQGLDQLLAADDTSPSEAVEKAELEKATDEMWANLPDNYQWLKEWEYV